MSGGLLLLCETTDVVTQGVYISIHTHTHIYICPAQSNVGTPETLRVAPVIAPGRRRVRSQLEPPPVVIWERLEPPLREVSSQTLV